MAEEGSPVENIPITPSFKEYRPQLLRKDDLRKITALLFGVDPKKVSGEELGRRLSEDKLLVRQKYSLPREEIWIQQPVVYYQQLEEIASRERIPIKNKEEYGKYFQQRFASAAHLGSEGGVIAMDKVKDTDSVSTVAQKAATLEHELVHAMQFRRYPQMPLVRQEYEAYLAHANPEVLLHKPWLFLERMSISISPDQLKAAWEQRATP